MKEVTLSINAEVVALSKEYLYESECLSKLPETQFENFDEYEKERDQLIENINRLEVRIANMTAVAVEYMNE